MPRGILQAEIMVCSLGVFWMTTDGPQADGLGQELPPPEPPRKGFSILSLGSRCCRFNKAVSVQIPGSFTANALGPKLAMEADPCFPGLSQALPPKQVPDPSSSRGRPGLANQPPITTECGWGDSNPLPGQRAGDAPCLSADPAGPRTTPGDTFRHRLSLSH